MSFFCSHKYPSEKKKGYIMETIKTSALAEELETLRAISSDRTLKPHEKYKMIEEFGYSLEYLGSGRTAYTCAHQVAIQNIHSQKYLNGNYIVYGTWCIKHGRGVIYRGYVKLIVED